MMEVFTKWKEALVGITTAICLIYLVDLTHRAYLNMIPTSQIFEVHDIFIPDHVSGSNPEMIYDRSIYMNFYGRFNIEVQEMEYLPDTVCNAAGAHTYTPSSTKLIREVNWNWFMENNCMELKPGLYRLLVTYSIITDGYPVKTYTVTSNTFQVKAVKNDQLH